MYKGGTVVNELTQSEREEIEEFQKYKYDTQMLIEGEDLDDLDIRDYITEHFEGNELLVVGDDELIKIHFHTNEPWLVLAYCATPATCTTSWWKTCSARRKGCRDNAKERRPQ